MKLRPRTQRAMLLMLAMFGMVLAFPAQKEKKWIPTKVPASASFAGTQTCGECHASKVKTHSATMMGQALEGGGSSLILKANPHLSFKSGPYLIEIITEKEKSIYKVSNGREVVVVPILYSFGQGHAGQTYVLDYKGALHESRVSFYNDINGLDYTIGASRSPSTTIDEAVGRPTPHDESVQCFACHSSGAAVAGKLNLDTVVPGIGCEICHGPGKEHIRLGKAGEANEDKIFNPGKLSADDLSQEFCASCHRGVEDVFGLPNSGGLNNVRFQPYRIFNSKCYSDDKRISCVACHDPHVPMSREARFYDSKCASCHSTSNAGSKLCKVGKSDCVTCHMPKTEIPGAHYKFADHRIRIARPGEKYPF